MFKYAACVLLQHPPTWLLVINAAVLGKVQRFAAAPCVIVAIQHSFLMSSDFFPFWPLLVKEKENKQPQRLWAFVSVPRHLSADVVVLKDGFIWVRRIHVCVRTTGWPVSSRECKMMSCDSLCPALIYLTPASARPCLASGYQFALVQEETGREWALNIDYRPTWHNERAFIFSLYQISAVQHRWNNLYDKPVCCVETSLEMSVECLEKWNAARKKDWALPQCGFSLSVGESPAEFPVDSFMPW